ncbi:MAG: peptide chain release factor N(5)-glutamine methyltransferase [Verrucomicrobia bacterium]|nr:peptide chain release factor N(5)-glutamine methyltransferase [Verrucomicrobiota bacterium]
MTVLEVIHRSSEFLTKKGVESPRLQVELLLAHLLRLPRMKLYLNFERVLTSAELDRLRELVRRRGHREPLQHIVGTTSFCGLELAVNRHALIPRPETELLAERAWQFLHQQPTVLESTLQRAPLSEQPEGWTPTALDFGTGSGCLAITLAIKCPTAQLFAIDISSEALELARQNAVRHGVEARIQFLASDGFAALPNGVRFNLIVANPPYISSATIATLAPEVRDHDPRLALDGGTEGLDFYRRLAKEATPYLRPDGRIMLELGDGQSDKVSEIFHQQKWVVEAVQEDYSRQPRILVARPTG